MNAGGRGSEANATRIYRDAIGRTSELWTIPEATHTGGLRTRPAEYERPATALLDRALRIASDNCPDLGAFPRRCDRA